MRNSLIELGVTLLFHVAQWVTRAPPHHTLPAFLNLNGSFYTILRNVAGNLDVEEILDDSGIRTLLQTVGIVGIVVFAILAALEITLACFGCNSKLNKTNIA